MPLRTSSLVKGDCVATFFMELPRDTRHSCGHQVYVEIPQVTGNPRGSATLLRSRSHHAGADTTADVRRMFTGQDAVHNSFRG